jgi:hypothetical protein
MTALNLPALREAVAKVPDLVWLNESGISWCDPDEFAAIISVLTYAPALLDELEAANAALETAYKEGFNTAQYYCAGKHSHGTPDAAWQAWPGRQR